MQDVKERSLSRTIHSILRSQPSLLKIYRKKWLPDTDSEQWNLYTKHKEQKQEQNPKDAEEGSGKYTFGCKPILTPGSYSSHTGKR